MTAADTHVRSGMHGAICRAELAVHNVIKYGFEVVEEDGVGGTFEDECEAPIWIDAAARRHASSRHGGVGEEEGDGKELVNVSERLRCRKAHIPCTVT